DDLAARTELSPDSCLPGLCHRPAPRHLPDPPGRCACSGFPCHSPRPSHGCAVVTNLCTMSPWPPPVPALGGSGLRPCRPRPVRVQVSALAVLTEHSALGLALPAGAAALPPPAAEGSPQGEVARPALPVRSLLRGGGTSIPAQAGSASAPAPLGPCQARLCGITRFSALRRPGLCAVPATDCSVQSPSCTGGPLGCLAGVPAWLWALSRCHGRHLAASWSRHACSCLGACSCSGARSFLFTGWACPQASARPMPHCAHLPAGGLLATCDMAKPRCSGPQPVLLGPIKMGLSGVPSVGSLEGLLHIAFSSAVSSHTAALPGLEEARTPWRVTQSHSPPLAAIMCTALGDHAARPCADVTGYELDCLVSEPADTDSPASGPPLFQCPWSLAPAAGVLECMFRLVPEVSVAFIPVQKRELTLLVFHSCGVRSLRNDHSEGGFFFPPDKAPLSKSLLLVPSALSLLLALLLPHCQRFFVYDLQAVKHDLQIWRLISGRIICLDLKDTFCSSLLIYNFRVFERRYGSRKFASFLLGSWVLSALVDFVLVEAVQHSLGIAAARNLPSG
ncbi:Ubiquitin-associated domain-containing protein 2, partial [Galemys pyrenaicus]